jgi:hypothetical protein
MRFVPGEAWLPYEHDIGKCILARRNGAVAICIEEAESDTEGMDKAPYANTSLNERRINAHKSFNSLS